MLIIAPGTQTELDGNRVTFTFRREDDAIVFFQWIAEASRTGRIHRIKIVRKTKDF